MLLDLDNDEILIFFLKDLDLADYLINAYINWILGKSLDVEYCPTIKNVLKFVGGMFN